MHSQDLPPTAESPASGPPPALSPIQARRAAAAKLTEPAATLSEELARGKAHLRLLVGGKHLKVLDKLIGDLRKLHPHGNRDLHFDNAITILLLGFFNSDIRSLRKLEMLSEVPSVQKKMDVDRICRTTLSDGLKLFDPAPLRGIVDELRKALPAMGRSEPLLGQLFGKITPYDGSYFRVPARVHWAIHETSRAKTPGRQVRLNLHFCLETGTPAGITIGGDGDSEAQGIIPGIEPDLIYVGDRGIFSHKGMAAILAGGANFVFRLKKRVNFVCLEERALTPEDHSAGIISDRVGYLPGSRREPAATATVREIIIANPDDPDQPIRLLTDLMDQPANIIGHIYRQRWSIELFFRWLKVYANFEHMISHSENGVETWFYVAVIGTLLMCLHTGQAPSTHAFTAAGLVASGQATYADLAAALARRAREREMTRARLARKRAAKTST